MIYFEVLIVKRAHKQSIIHVVDLRGIRLVHKPFHEINIETDNFGIELISDNNMG